MILRFADPAHPPPTAVDVCAVIAGDPIPACAHWAYAAGTSAARKTTEQAT